MACALCATASPCFAQCTNAENCSSTAIWLSAAALVIAVAALMLAVRNYRISKVNMINSTEDFQLMLDSTKKTIDKDIKNLRREMQRNMKPATKPANESKTDAEADGDEKVEMPSRRSSGQRRRSNYHRRRSTNSEGEQTDNQATE